MQPLIFMPRNNRNSASRNSRSRPRNGRRSRRRSNVAPSHLRDTPYLERLQLITHKVFAVAQITLPYIPLTGINGSGNNIIIAVTQPSMQYSINGAGYANVAFINSPSFSTVFQEYRIMEFSVETFVSMNTASTPTTSSSGAYFPMLYATVDREDDLPLTNVAQVLQFPVCNVTQVGSTQGPKTITCYRPSVAIGANNNSSSIGTVVAAAVERSPWLTCGTNASNAIPAIIPHGYVKIFIDNLGSGYSQTMCNITFVVRTIMEYRGID